MPPTRPMSQEFREQNALLVDGQLLCRHFIWGRCIKAGYDKRWQVSVNKMETCLIVSCPDIAFFFFPVCRVTSANWSTFRVRTMSSKKCASITSKDSAPKGRAAPTCTISFGLTAIISICCVVSTVNLSVWIRLFVWPVVMLVAAFFLKL